jgi:GntR family transcriptional regulator / MocR family aminotransferase
MPKTATPFELALPPRDPAVPVTRWLCQALRAEILEGRLRPGARLPASRELARQYRLARGTVVAAFEQLRAEGYLEGRTGSGTRVSAVLPDALLQVAGVAAAPRTVRRPGPRGLSDYARRVQLFPGLQPRPTRAFRANLPALDLFPTTLWAQVAGRRFRRATTRDLMGCGPLGYPPLQEAIADYLRVSRGVNCVADQVVILSGVQEALDLAARLLLNPGDEVAMEDPGYSAAALAFEANGARIRPVPLDREGMAVPGAPLKGIRLVYLTPAHQFPTGGATTLARRLELLDWAWKAGALVFEDDYDSEYRYAGRPTPAMQGLDRHGAVLFAGSFSKVLFPALRLGYLVPPPDLLDRIAATRSVTVWHPPLLDQAVVCDFITEGHFGRHLRRMREIYAQRCGMLLEGARESLAGLLEIEGVEAGLQTAGRLAPGISAESLAAALAARQVEVTPLSRYARAPLARDGLQLGFAAVDSREIRRGLQELARALEREQRSAR